MLRSGMKESHESIPYLWNRYAGEKADIYDRILLPLPRGPFSNAVADYARKSIVQFVTDFSAGGTVARAINAGEG
jgi:hypothetical protein